MGRRFFWPTHCLWVAAHYSAFFSFSPCNTTVHLVFFGAAAHGGCLFISSSPEELTCAVRLSLNTGSTFGNLTPLPSGVRLETLWRSWATAALVSCRVQPRRVTCSTVPWLFVYVYLVSHQVLCRRTGIDILGRDLAADQPAITCELGTCTRSGSVTVPLSVNAAMLFNAS